MEPSITIWLFIHTYTYFYHIWTAFNVRHCFHFRSEFVFVCVCYFFIRFHTRCCDAVAVVDIILVDGHTECDKFAVQLQWNICNLNQNLKKCCNCSFWNVKFRENPNTITIDVHICIFMDFDVSDRAISPFRRMCVQVLDISRSFNEEFCYKSTGNTNFIMFL